MKKFTNKIPKKAVRIIVSTVIAAAGLLILMFPDTSLLTVCFTLGGFALIAGLVKTVRYIKERNRGTANILDIISGIILLTAAVMLILHPHFLTSILPFIIGVSVISYGVSTFFAVGNGIFGKIFSVITAIYGISLVINPFKGATALVSVLGLGLFIFGIVKTVREIFRQTESDNIRNNIDGDGYIEVDFTDI